MNVQLIPYQSQVDDSELNVYYHDNTFWLTLNSMSCLFNCSAQKIYVALREIQQKDVFNTMVVNQYIEVTSNSGKKSIGNFYNLDVIIAIGYRLNPKEATEFRLWSLFMTKNYMLEQVKMEYGVIGSLKRTFSHMLSA